MIVALAPRFLENELEVELRIRGIRPAARSGRLFLCDTLSDPGLIWADDVWEDVQVVPVASIAQGGRILKKFGIPFANASQENFRRAELMLQNVRRFPLRRLRFGEALPPGPWAVFALPAPNCLWVSLRTRARVPLGWAEFEENRTEPPSRAYLKLWELFTVHGVRVPGKRVVDLGAAPGGWTWVLAQMGFDVTAVDKAPLAEAAACHPHVRILRQSAFGLDPRELGPVDAVFSDIICYPARALMLVKKWMQAGTSLIVCTVKFQGPTDWDAIRAFGAIDGSRLIHQYANKHELTWVWTRENAEFREAVSAGETGTAGMPLPNN